MSSPLKNLSPFTYLSLVLLVFSNFTRYFLVDTDLGARFKNFNRELTVSDIQLGLALLMFVVGVVWKIFKHHKKARMKGATIKLSFVLIMPLLFIMVLTPFLETFIPASTGDNFLSTLFIVLTMIATICCFAWIIHLVVTVLKQLYFIITYK